MKTESYYTNGIVTRTAIFNDGRFYEESDIRPSTYHLVKQNSVPGDRHTPTPYSYEIEQQHAVIGVEGLREPGEQGYSIEWSGPGMASGDMPNRINTLSGICVDPYNKAMDRLFEQIRRDIDLSIDLYQGGSTLATLRKVSSAISHPIRTFADVTSALVRKNKVRRGSKMSGNLWLEYIYGVKPTMDTIFALTSEATGALSAGKGGLVRLKASASKQASETRSTHFGESHSFSSCIPMHESAWESRRCKIGVNLSIASAERYALSQFTSLNPISFIYENIPFSFVIDWAYDIGNYLRNMETALLCGLEFHSGYISETTKRINQIEVIGGGSLYGLDRYGSGRGSFRLTTHNRSVLYTMPLPRPPSFKINLGATRLTSAAALLSQLISIPSSRRK